MPNVVDGLTSKELMLQLSRAMASLPKPFRQAYIAWKTFDTVPAAAGFLEIPVDLFYSRINRARGLLLEKLERFIS